MLMHYVSESDITDRAETGRRQSARVGFGLFLQKNLNHKIRSWLRVYRQELVSSYKSKSITGKLWPQTS